MDASFFIYFGIFYEVHNFHSDFRHSDKMAEVKYYALGCKEGVISDTDNVLLGS